MNIRCAEISESYFDLNVQRMILVLSIYNCLDIDLHYGFARTSIDDKNSDDRSQ